jgi:hypothetical protein
MHRIVEPSFSPRLDAVEHCTSRAIPNIRKTKNLAARCCSHRAECSSKAEIAACIAWVSRRIRIRSGPRRDCQSYLTERGFMCALVIAQPSDLGFKCLSRNLELGCGARRTANGALAILLMRL